MAVHKGFANNVFINCPFDPAYNAFLEAIVFAIHDCGFVARCAREENDGGDVRFMKLIKIIDECKFGIHDISKADLDEDTQLARFNMPLELGLFLGAGRFAPVKHYNRDKKVLIMDKEAFRYQQFISDLSGQDVVSHGDSEVKVIHHICEFLFANTKRKSIASGQFINDRFNRFIADLPELCAQLNWNRESLSYIRYITCVTEWLKANLI